MSADLLGNDVNDMWAAAGGIGAGGYNYGAHLTYDRFLTDDGSPVVVSFNTKPTNGVWNHLVATHDVSEKTIQLYLNGASDNSDTYSGSLDTTWDKKAFMGLRSLGDTNHTHGSINEFSIWNKTLSLSEVQELYNDGKALDARDHSASPPTGTDNLVGYWRNNGLSDWEDLSQTGEDGVIDGATETLLIPAGVDGSRDNQGFLMNRQRTTNSLNLPIDGDMGATGFSQKDGAKVEIVSAPEDSTDGSFDALGNGLGDFTIEFWIKCNYVSDSANVIYQSVGNDSSDWQGLDIYVDADNSLVGAFYYHSGSSAEAWFDSDASANDIEFNDGEWHHCVFIADRSANATLIVDKKVESIIDISTRSALECFTSSQKIGSSSSESGYSGSNRDSSALVFDDFRIYKKVLSFDTDGSIAVDETVTSGEVLRNYNAGKRSHR